MSDVLLVSRRITELIDRLVEVEEKMKKIEEQAAILEKRIVEA